MARGPIDIRDDGRPLWRMMVYLGTVYPDDPMKDEILWDELEILRDGKAICTYRPKVNFSFNTRTHRLDRVPEDTQFIAGESCPSVRALRDGYAP